MRSRSDQVLQFVGAGIGAIWVFHGLYSKLLNRIPRHRAIVARVLGDDIATPATRAIGILEIGLGLWVWSGRARKTCALTQTVALGTMNTLEIARAEDLLVSAPGMLALNAGLLTLAWIWAVRGSERR